MQTLYALVSSSQTGAFATNTTDWKSVAGMKTANEDSRSTH